MHPSVGDPKITGQHLKTLDVDIETTTKLIECKNFDWQNLSQEIIEKRLGWLRDSLPELKRLAISNGKIFEFHSKYPIPGEFKQWLIKRGIAFYEG